MNIPDTSGRDSLFQAEARRCKEILDEYGITCNNFILYRTMEGDVSDNIPGLDGVGLKRVVKAFPFLANEDQSCLQQIYNYYERII